MTPREFAESLSREQRNTVIPLITDDLERFKQAFTKEITKQAGSPLHMRFSADWYDRSKYHELPSPSGSANHTTKTERSKRKKSTPG